jgi:hypothetical protein
MKRFHRLLGTLTIIVSCATAGRADSAAMIAKARAFLGGEKALQGVTSVHYVGKLETTEETKDGPKPTSCSIEIIFQKPYQQRITLTTESIIGVTGLDHYESWQSQESRVSGARRVDFHSKDQLKRFQASTWENLNFFSGTEARGGQVEDGGVIEKGGEKLYKVNFVHGPGIEFTRYFDPATGQLKLTETANSVIREEGSIDASGVRFPKKIIQTDHFPNGKEQVVTITFDKITINESFPPDFFRAPQPVAAKTMPTATEQPR